MVGFGFSWIYWQKEKHTIIRAVFFSRWIPTSKSSSSLLIIIIFVPVQQCSCFISLFLSYFCMLLLFFISSLQWFSDTFSWGWETYRRSRAESNFKNNESYSNQSLYCMKPIIYLLDLHRAPHQEPDDNRSQTKRWNETERHDFSWLQVWFDHVNSLTSAVDSPVTFTKTDNT